MNFVLLAAGNPPVSISPPLRTVHYAALEFITQCLDEEFNFWLEALSEPVPAAPKA